MVPGPILYRQDTCKPRLSMSSATGASAARSRMLLRAPAWQNNQIELSKTVYAYLHIGMTVPCAHSVRHAATMRGSRAMSPAAPPIRTSHTSAIMSLRPRPNERRDQRDSRQAVVWCCPLLHLACCCASSAFFRERASTTNPAGWRQGSGLFQNAVNVRA